MHSRSKLFSLVVEHEAMCVCAKPVMYQPRVTVSGMPCAMYEQLGRVHMDCVAGQDGQEICRVGRGLVEVRLLHLCSFPSP